MFTDLLCAYLDAMGLTRLVYTVTVVEGDIVVGSLFRLRLAQLLIKVWLD